MNARRGSAYILVLAVSMVIVMLGVTSSHLMRIRSTNARLSEDETRAALLARSAVEVMIKALNDDPSWRTSHVHDQWSDMPRTIHDGTFIYKLSDEDGDLADDTSDDVRLTVLTTRGEATRIYSVLLRPSAGTTPVNLLTNGGFENGTNGWNRYFCTLVTQTSDPVEGTQFLRATSRLSNSGSPVQDLVGVLVDPGTTYRIRFFVRINGASRSVRANILTAGSTGSSLVATPWILIDADTWTEINETLTPSFSAPLSLATLSFYTDGGLEDVDFDDVRLTVDTTGSTLSAVDGTWRREVLP